MRRTYLVYDDRAWGLGSSEFDTDAALVLCCADSLSEAKQDVTECFPDGLVFSYLDDGEYLCDERFEWALCMEGESGEIEVIQKPRKPVPVPCDK